MIKYILLVVISVVAVTAQPPLEELKSYTFEQYVVDFEKNVGVSEEEFLYRKMIFQNNLRKILAHNADETQSWKMGINQFADLTETEFKRYLGGKKTFKEIIGEEFL